MMSSYDTFRGTSTLTEEFTDPRKAMAAGARWCFYVPYNAQQEARGFVPALVVENVPGYFPLVGNGPFASPWVWGPTLEDAQRIAAEKNAQRGVSSEMAALIVASSIGASRL